MMDYWLLSLFCLKLLLNVKKQAQSNVHMITEWHAEEWSF